MARKALDIKIRVERQEKIIKYAKRKVLVPISDYLDYMPNFKKLLEEQREEDKKKLFEAYRKSKRSLDEILDYMRGRAEI